MAESAYATDLKSVVRKGMWVQIPPGPLRKVYMSYYFVRITDTNYSPLSEDAFAIMVNIDYDFKKHLNKIYHNIHSMFLIDGFYSVSFFDNSIVLVSQDFLVNNKMIHEIMNGELDGSCEYVDFMKVLENEDFLKPNYSENLDACMLIVKKDGIMWRMSSTDLCPGSFETETIPWDEIIETDGLTK